MQVPKCVGVAPKEVMPSAGRTGVGHPAGSVATSIGGPRNRSGWREALSNEGGGAGGATATILHVQHTQVCTMHVSSRAARWWAKESFGGSCAEEAEGGTWDGSGRSTKCGGTGGNTNGTAGKRGRGVCKGVEDKKEMWKSLHRDLLCTLLSLKGPTGVINIADWGQRWW